VLLVPRIYRCIVAMDFLNLLLTLFMLCALSAVNVGFVQNVVSNIPKTPWPLVHGRTIPTERPQIYLSGQKYHFHQARELIYITQSYMSV
jgi:hypothetical protein